MGFENITIVGVDSRNDGRDLVPAIQYSMKELPGSKGLLLSKDDISVPFSHHRLEMPFFNRKDFSFFMLYCLHNFIKTEYIITVHDDGWILNGKNWDDAWYDYDYIGAPCHIAKCENEFIGNGNWINILNEKTRIVFNGGFSFRSKKLLECPSKLGLVPSLWGFKSLNNNIDELYNEDIQLCCFMRDILEKHEIKFANLEVAKIFSFEHLYPKVNDDLNLTKVFGHHSRLRKLIDNKTVNYRMSKEYISQVYGENKIFDLFKNYGYTLYE